MVADDGKRLHELRPGSTDNAFPIDAENPCVHGRLLLEVDLILRTYAREIFSHRAIAHVFVEGSGFDVEGTSDIQIPLVLTANLDRWEVIEDFRDPRIS